ncbi:MAG TPA: YggT family protein [Thermodesulfobacteriota bacterium]|nr:YggT family protein [Thermodesulfobacteriota bacterium]
MVILGNFVIALATVIHFLLYAYMWIVIIRAIISWVNPDPYNPIVNFLYRATEPVLGFARRIVPPIGGIDLSPILVLVLIVFLDQFLVETLNELGFRIKRGDF